MRRLRKRSGKTLREVAAGMKVTLVYVSELELEKKQWSHDLGERYLKAVRA